MNELFKHVTMVDEDGTDIVMLIRKDRILQVMESNSSEKEEGIYSIILYKEPIADEKVTLRVTQKIKTLCNDSPRGVKLL